MTHKQNPSQQRRVPGYQTGLKRQIEASAEVSLPRRVGELFIKTHNLDSVCAKIDRLSKWRDSIIEDRDFLNFPESQKVLETAKFMDWREQTYLANEAGLEKDIAQWPEDIQKILKQLLEKAKFRANDRVYGKDKPGTVADPGGEVVDPKVEVEKEEPCVVIDLS